MLHNYCIFLLTFLVLFIGNNSTAQNFGNDWFAAYPDADYVKISVWEDGYYNISHADLLAQGHNLSAVDADSIQLFYRGIDRPLHVEKGPNGDFAAFSFWGEKHDGAEDSILYRHPITGFASPNEQPNRSISLFSDTAAYFLTWNRTKGKRYQDISDFNYQNYTPEPSFPFESRLDPNPNDTSESKYYFSGGNIYGSFYQLNSSYVTGQGYLFSQGFQIGNPMTLDLQTRFALPGSHSFEIKTRVFGISNTPHHLRIEGDGMLILDTAIISSSIYLRTYTRQINGSLDSVFSLEYFALWANTDDNVIAFASIRYPHIPDMDNAAEVAISEWVHPGSAYFQLAHPDGIDSIWAIDPVRGIRSKGIIQGDTAFIVLSTTTGQDVHLVTDNGIRTPMIQANHSLTNLCDPNAGAEYIIITHRRLAPSAQEYADHRASHSSHPYTTKLVFLDEIYDEFGYGTPTPWAMKRFMSCGLDTWVEKPKYVLLWGEGSFLLRGNSKNLVPTYGYPVGDYDFVIPISQGVVDFKPKVSIGRVSIQEDFEGRDYLNKVADLESQPFSPWRKKALFLGGGANAGEQNAIRSGFQYFANRVSNDLDTFLYLKGINLPLDSIGQDSSPFHDLISDGVGLLHYFGHSSSNLHEVMLRGPSVYQNASRYPLFISMGGFGGDFSVRESFGEKWVKAPNRGCIAYLSNSAAGYLNPLRDFGRVFYDQLIGPQSGEPIGDVIRETLNIYLDSLTGIQYRNHGRQMVLQGDPALRLFEARPLSISPKKEDGFRVYPNPVAERLFIEMPSSKDLELFLSSIDGKTLLYQNFVGKNRYELAMPDLVPGVYVLRLVTKEGMGVRKLMVR